MARATVSAPTQRIASAGTSLPRTNASTLSFPARRRATDRTSARASRSTWRAWRRDAPAMAVLATKRRKILRRFVASGVSAGVEVLGPRVVADDGGGGLLRLVLVAGLLGDLDAEAVGLQQPGDGDVVLEVGTRRVAPR